MSNQSFMQVFVTNSPALLANGATVENLAVHQVGILDAKSNVGVTSPTYAKNKALKLVWGTPDLSHLPLMSGAANENEYSKLIKGKLLKDFQGNKAKKGQTEIWTVGNSGEVSDTDTLFAKLNEVKHLFIKLTGGPIDKLFSKQGITRQFSTVVRSSAPDCDDPCTDADCRLIAQDLVKQINSDPLIGTVGTRKGLIKASVIEQCTSPDAGTTDTDYVFELRVCDTQDDNALGVVQANYPNDVVKRIAVEGSKSVYEIIRDTNSTPSAFSNEDFTLVPFCDACPSGYTESVGGFAYKVIKADAGDGTALTDVGTDYSIAGDETVTRLQFEAGVSTYIVVSSTELTANGTDTLIFLGETRGTCVLTDPTTISWAASGTLTKYGKTFTLTIADSICGENRLTDIQAAFPDLTVAIVDADGDCVHKYTTTVFSQAVEVGCSPDELKWIKPQAFEGIQWKEDTTLPDEGTCVCGIKLEVAFVNRVTGECTFDYFPYEAETIHIQVSSFNPDYNAHPDEATWAVKQIQAYQHPSGFGAQVRKLEKESKSYDLRERSFDPVVREIEGYSFAADPNKYYDEYVLSFDFGYEVGGWSDKYTDSYRLYVYFPEGQGKNFESAINAYISSAALQIDPVVL
jgi:hypothetical protein